MDILLFRLSKLLSKCKFFCFRLLFNYDCLFYVLNCYIYIYSKGYFLTDPNNVGILVFLFLANEMLNTLGFLFEAFVLVVLLSF